MKFLLLTTLCFAHVAALAQAGPKSPPPPDSGKLLQAPKDWMPKGWIYIPPDEASGKETWSPYMKPMGAPTLATFPNAGFRSDADAALIKAQTDAIKALSKRVDELESRIAGLEGRGGAKK
jgi:hypothetical protein